MSDYFYSLEWAIDVMVLEGLGYVSGALLWSIANENNL